MRTQLINVEGEGSFVLRAQPGAGEHVDYDGLSWLEQQSYPLLATVRDEERGGKVRALLYSFDEGTCVRDWLKKPVDSNLYLAALVSVADALAYCSTPQLNLTLLLDPALVYADRAGKLHFCCVPIVSKSVRKRSSLTGLLGALSQGSVRVLGGVGAQAREQLQALVASSRGGVDLPQYVRFLAVTLGLRLSDGLLAMLEAGPVAHDATTAAVPSGQAGGSSWRGVNDRAMVGAYGRDRGEDVWSQVMIEPPSSDSGYQAAPQPIPAHMAPRPAPAPAPQPQPAPAPAPQPTPRHARKRHASPAPQPAPKPTPTMVQVPSRPAPTAGNAPLYLLVRLRTGEQFRLGEDEVVEVGRGPECTVRIHDSPKLSRRHARLRCSGGQAWLRDEGSANGTWLAGSRLDRGEEREVGINQRFSLADEEFYIRKA